MNKKGNNCALNCEAHSSFDGVSSDHWIVTAKIRLNLRRNAARTTTTIHYAWSLLNNRDIKDKYTLTLRNKFDALQEITETPTPNDEYENFVNAHLEAATECIPTKQRAKPTVPWKTLAIRKMFFSFRVILLIFLNFWENLPWINVNLLNQNPCMPSWRFPLGTFLSIALRDSTYMYMLYHRGEWYIEKNKCLIYLFSNSVRCIQKRHSTISYKQFTRNWGGSKCCIV